MRRAQAADAEHRGGPNGGLRQAAAGVTLNVSSKGINESAALERRIRRRRTKAVLLTVAVRDANGKITDLTARISHLTG